MTTTARAASLIDDSVGVKVNLNLTTVNLFNLNLKLDPKSNDHRST